VDSLLVLLFLAVIVGAAVVYLRGRRKEAAAGAPAPAGLPAAAPDEPTEGAELRALKVGDVVNHEGRDWIVEGTLRFNQGGFRWDEHRLVDGADALWLSIEDDDGLEVVLWERLRGAALEPGAPSIDHDGVSYELDERGRANFTSEGRTGAPGGGRAEFADYARGEQRLSFERYGGEDAGWEVSVGRVVSEFAFDIYPSRGAGG
jgi:hypothetical protein